MKRWTGSLLCHPWDLPLILALGVRITGWRRGFLLGGGEHDLEVDMSDETLQRLDTWWGRFYWGLDETTH